MVCLFIETGKLREELFYLIFHLMTWLSGTVHQIHAKNNLQICLQQNFSLKEVQLPNLVK